jgi:metallo-beta-lactamase family protein
MRIGFFGAVGTVTGSKFLVESGSTRLLVDCGLFQGLKQLRLRNWRPIPFSPKSVDAVLLTHAHIDHSGFLPVLVREGFQGPVYCTPPTAALCELLLPDAAYLLEEDARYVNRKKISKHSPARPLYTQEDTQVALERLRSVEFGESLSLGDLTAEFLPAGHILGASSVRLRDSATKVLFSGDLGRSDDLLMYPPAPPADADWMVVESTYGGRSHAEEDPVVAIAEILARTVERSGTLLIPSFAVGRAQTLLLCLHEIFERGLAPRVPVSVNSPMATNATELYRRFDAYHKLSPELCATVWSGAHYARSVEESKALVASPGPRVVISASGMATGGRILHHLRALAPDPRNAILIPGFQAPGTRGAALAGGTKAVKIHGELVPVRAEVVQLDSLSAHADREDLVDWVASAARPHGIHLVHGEPVAADSLRCAIRDRIALEPEIPEYRDSVELR